jgi:hypothetical protein
MVNGIAGLRFGWIASRRFGGVTGTSKDLGWEVGYVGCNCWQQQSYHLCHHHRQEFGMGYCCTFVVGGLTAVVVW